MRKWMLTLLIAIFALPFFGSSVSAETTSDFENGTYEDINYKVMHETEDKKSAADGFMSKPATLKVENGNQYIELELTGSSMIKSLTVPSGEVDLISKDKDENTRIVGFKVEGDLSEPLIMDMHVVVPGMYEETHKALAFFDVSEVPVKPVEEGETTIPEEEETEAEEEVNELEIIDLEDDYYTTIGNYIKSDNDDLSTMGNYLDQSLFVSFNNEKIAVTITINENDTVTLLQLDGKNAVESISDGDKRHETFELDSLTSLVDAYVEYQAPYGDGIFEGNAQFRVSLEGADFIKTDASEKPGGEAEKQEDEENPREPEDPKDTEDPKNNEGPGNNQGTENNEKSKEKEEADDKGEQPETSKPKDLLKPDKAYTIDYIIKHESEDKPSAGDSFFEKPGVLLYKDGEKYIQLTVTGTQFIESLKTAHGDMVIVKENEDGSRVVQFKVDGEITDIIILDMQINVPGMESYDGKHKARLFLDENSMKEVDDPNVYRLAAAANENGPTVDDVSGKTVSGNEIVSTPNSNNGTIENDKVTNETKNKDTKTPEKPEFGYGNDNSSNTETTASGPQNPKTGDTTNIMLYVLLLIGSAIPLAIQLKRRFI